MRIKILTIIFVAALLSADRAGARLRADQNPSTAVFQNENDAEGNSPASPAAVDAQPAAPSPPRLLTSAEGLYLVKAALRRPPEADENPDCSHLVHDLYLSARLDYPYATSFDLYEGVSSFQRVRKPQPGDLIVWKGHVGMVVDPAHHSFYSALGSGEQTGAYDSRYWKKRGRPRFYRFLVESPTLVAGQNKVERAAMDDAAIPPALPAKTASAASSPQSAAVRPMDLVSIPVPSTRATPRPEEVAQAISELANAAGGFLQSESSPNFPTPVMVINDFRVERVKASKTQGWAQVRVNSILTLADGKIARQRQSRKEKWQLRQTSQGWIALPPPGQIYVSRALALRAFSEQLAASARDAAAESPLPRQAALVRLLDVLVDR